MNTSCFPSTIPPPTIVFTVYCCRHCCHHCHCRLVVFATLVLSFSLLTLLSLSLLLTGCLRHSSFLPLLLSSPFTLLSLSLWSASYSCSLATIVVTVVFTDIAILATLYRALAAFIALVFCSPSCFCFSVLDGLDICVDKNV